MWWEQYGQWNELGKKDSDKNRKMKDHWDRLNSLQQEVDWLEEQRLHWQQLAEKKEQSR
jgi:hypothetical protein